MAKEKSLPGAPLASEKRQQSADLMEKEALPALETKHKVVKTIIDCADAELAAAAAQGSVQDTATRTKVKSSRVASAAASDRVKKGFGKQGEEAVEENGAPLKKQVRRKVVVVSKGEAKGKDEEK
jgi:hypothetical protein